MIKYKILGVKVSSAPKAQLLDNIKEKLTIGKKFYITTPNPEIILMAQNNSDLSSAINKSNFAIPDGIGLKLTNSNLEIIKGRELMLDLLSIANERKLKVYLLGSRNNVIKKSLNILISQYPNIKVKGNSGPQLDKNANPVSEVDISLHSEIVKEINLFKPDLLFVALGAPKQELWIAKNIDKLNMIGAMAIGGALDYYSGFVKPVPKILESLQLEWLWRLIQEPRRIKRIINAVIVFPLKLILSYH